MKKKVKKASKKKSVKKPIKKNSSKKNGNGQTAAQQTLTLGQKSADFVTKVLGSWGFILFFLLIMVVWIYLNIRAIFGTWDPYPYILLNFVLSCLAAIQAPIILMSQNRQTERDRINFKYDYQVNRKAEREIQKVMREVAAIKRHIYKHLNEDENKKKK